MALVVYLMVVQLDVLSSFPLSPPPAPGHVRMEPLERLSEKLRRNAASLQAGPGLPTSIAVHSKFITIGTSRSLVLVFDHFQVPCFAALHTPILSNSVQSIC